MPNPHDFITIRQAAEMIAVSTATLRHWDRTGELKVVRNPTNRCGRHHAQDVSTLLATLRAYDQAGVRG